jgi:hypothetical protein
MSSSVIASKVCNINLKQNVFLHFAYTSTVYIVHFVFVNKVYQGVRSTSFSRSTNKNGVRRFSLKWSINRYLNNKQVINTHWNLFDFQIFHKSDVPLKSNQQISFSYLALKSSKTCFILSFRLFSQLDKYWTLCFDQDFKFFFLAILWLFGKL